MSCTELNVTDNFKSFDIFDVFRLKQKLFYIYINIYRVNGGNWVLGVIGY